MFSGGRANPRRGFANLRIGLAPQGESVRMLANLRCDAGGQQPATDDREKEQWRGDLETMALISLSIFMCA